TLYYLEFASRGDRAGPVGSVLRGGLSITDGMRELEALLMDRALNCRFCGHPVRHTFVDLGMSPLCQKHITADQLNHMEPFYPLHAYLCERCFLVQLEQFVAPSELFSEYAYFSSYSDSWVERSEERRVGKECRARWSQYQ